MQGVDAAVSAGGYNSVTELMFAGVPTVFLPQPRHRRRSRWARARCGRRAGAGRLASSARRSCRSCSRRPAIRPRPRARAAQRCARRRRRDPRDRAARGRRRDGAERGLRPSCGRARRSVGGDVKRPTRIARAGRRRAERRRRSATRRSPSSSPRRADRGAGATASPAAAARREVPHRSRRTADAPSTRRSRSSRWPRAQVPRGRPRRPRRRRVASCFRPGPASPTGWARVSLVNALPLQRGIAVGESRRVSPRGSRARTDLFDALRRFSHLEGNGTPLARRGARALGGAPHPRWRSTREQQARSPRRDIAPGAPDAGPAHGARRRHERVQRGVHHVLGSLAAARSSSGRSRGRSAGFELADVRGARSPIWPRSARSQPSSCRAWATRSSIPTSTR